jgi:hypothetical protein
MDTVSKDQLLLAEVEDSIRSMPEMNRLYAPGDPAILAWFGRAAAALKRCEHPSRPLLHNIFSGIGELQIGGVRSFVTLLHQARHDLLMRLPNAGSAAISAGNVFDYFDELRKIIGLAKQDLLFVDPYMDAAFVARYLPHVAAGVTIRLLAREKLDSLLPAVDLFAQQTGRKAEVRSARNFHDRYVLLDSTSCYQSRASFKDGAKSAPTTITQIIDAFPAVSKTYEDLWTSAHVER